MFNELRWPAKTLRYHFAYASHHSAFSHSFSHPALCARLAPPLRLINYVLPQRDAERHRGLILHPSPSNRGGLEDSSSNYKHSRSALRSGWGALSIRRSVSAAHLPTLGVLHNKKPNTHSTFKHSNIRTFEHFSFPVVSCQRSIARFRARARSGRAPAFSLPHFLIFSLSHFLILIFPHSHITFRRSRTKH